MADDEGTDNTVDMDRFYLVCNAFNCANSTDPGIQFNQVDQQVYGYASGGEVPMGPGSIHWANSSVILTYDTENYNFSFAKLNLKASARDYDGGWSSDEWASGQVNLVGNDIWGLKTIYLYSADFTIKAEIEITKGNKGGN